MIQMCQKLPIFRILPALCVFLLIQLSSASASLPVTGYVDPKSGVDSGSCSINAPCATLNYALSQSSAGGNIVVLQAGVFGPIRLTAQVSITGTDPNTEVQIVADPGAQVGCVGGAPGSCGPNSGYAVEIAAGANDIVSLAYVFLDAGPNGGAGALKFTSGGKIQLAHSVYRGNASATGPIVALYPNNGATTQAQVYFSDGDIGFNTANNAGAGAVDVKPSGNTSLKLHFNHVQVHNASYGIRTDGSLLSSPAVVVATVVSESEFFSFAYAAVNAFSTAGTGTVNATYDTNRILNAGVALKGNGPQSYVVLTNNTVSGNAIGILASGGANINTSGNNTVFGNDNDVSGSLSLQAMK